MNVIEASNIVIRYILSNLENAPTRPVMLLMTLKALCEGKSDVEANLSTTASLKYSKFPEHTKPNVSGSEKDSPKSELKNPRSDLSTFILSQLSKPLDGGSMSFSGLGIGEEQTDCTVSIPFDSESCPGLIFVFYRRPFSSSQILSVYWLIMPEILF